MVIPFAIRILAAMASLGTAQATLDFQSTSAKPSVGDDAQMVSQEYAFTATGTGPVTITKLESHCACLEATVSRMTWQPGESGTITLKMKPGALQGQMTKTVTVHQEQNGKQQETELALTVDLPKLFAFDPPVLKFEVGATAPQTCTIKILSQSPIRLTKVNCPDASSMSAKLTEVTPGKEYTLTATPASTAAKGIGVIEIQTDAAATRHRTQQLIYTLTAPKKSGK